LKIAGMDWAGTVKTQAALGELGLKDGQNIVGRIISMTDHTVLLQLAGKTLTAQLEGRPLSPGTAALFGVTLAKSGQVELKVLSNLTPAELTPESEAVLNSAGNQAALVAACRKLGWAGQAGQLGEIDREIRLFAARHGQTPPVELFVWLKMQNWPMTPGAILLAWLYRDQELRNLIWTRLRWLAQVKQEPEILPPVLEPDQSLPVPESPSPAGAADISFSRENSGASHPELAAERLDEADPLLQPQVLRENRSGWEQLRPLLEQSANLGRLVANTDSSAVTAVIPFLIQTSAALVTELRLEWSAESSRQGGSDEREELVRMVIPTENLGEIHLVLLVGREKTRINLKVASPAVRDYVDRYLAELKSQLNGPSQIGVSLISRPNSDETKVDLWM
jgi:hypothetical protein